MKNESALRAIYNALNQVEVHGRDNLDKLLGCIQALERLLTEEENDG